MAADRRRLGSTARSTPRQRLSARPRQQPGATSALVGDRGVDEPELHSRLGRGEGAPLLAHAIRESKFDEARALSAEGLAVAGGPETMAGTVALIDLAYIANVERRHRDAERLGRRALHASLRRGDRVAAVWTALAMGWSLAEQGDLKRSARLLGAYVALLENAGSARFWMDTACERQVLATLHDKLDGQAVKWLIEEGRKLPSKKPSADRRRGVQGFASAPANRTL